MHIYLKDFDSADPTKQFCSNSHIILIGVVDFLFQDGGNNCEKAYSESKSKKGGGLLSPFSTFL